MYVRTRGKSRYTLEKPFDDLITLLSWLAWDRWRCHRDKNLARSYITYKMDSGTSDRQVKPNLQASDEFRFGSLSIKRGIKPLDFYISQVIVNCQLVVCFRPTINEQFKFRLADMLEQTIPVTTICSTTIRRGIRHTPRVFFPFVAGLVCCVRVSRLAIGSRTLQETRDSIQIRCLLVSIPR